MRGSLRIKAGRYFIADRVALTIRASDDGVVVAIDMTEANQRYSAAITERGRVVWRHAEEVAPPGGNPNRPTYDPATVQPKLPPGCRTARKASRIKFVLKWGPAYKPRNSCYVVGGYTDGRSLHVLFRVTGGFGGSRDYILNLTPDVISIGNGVPPDDILPNNRWDEFLSLNDNASVRIGRLCRKMSLDELGQVIGGRTIQLGDTSKSE